MLGERTKRNEPRERSATRLNALRWRRVARVSACVGEADYGETSPKLREGGSASGRCGRGEAPPPKKSLARPAGIEPATLGLEGTPSVIPRRLSKTRQLWG